MMKFDTSKMKEALEDDMPELSPTPLGRHRLVKALSNKFGPSWRNNPKAKQAMSHFDIQHSHHQTLREIQSQHPSKKGVKRG